MRNLHERQINKTIEHSLTLSKQSILRQISSKLNITFIVTIDNLPLFFFYRDLTSRPHLAGLQEDLDSAIVIEQRWKNDNLQVTKPKYNVLLSYPNENITNRFQ